MRKRSIKRFRSDDKQTDKGILKYFTFDSAIVLAIISAALYFSGWSYYSRLCQMFNISLTQLEISHFAAFAKGWIPLFLFVSSLVVFHFIKCIVLYKIKNYSSNNNSLFPEDYFYGILLINSMLIVFSEHGYLRIIFCLVSIYSILLLYVIWVLQVDFNRMLRFKLYEKANIMASIIIAIICIALISDNLARMDAYSILSGTGVRVEIVNENNIIMSGLMIVSMNNYYYILNRVDNSAGFETVVVDKDKVLELNQTWQKSWP